MISYEDFIADETMCDGMKTIEMDDELLESVYHADVVYENINGITRTLQILSPSKRDYQNEKYPLLIYVQGSAWHKQDVYHNVPQFGYISRKGYVVAIVQYRESDLAPFPAQVQDAKTAIRFLRKHADEYHIDPQNVFIWGGSSGGHVALLTGFSQNVKELDSDLYLEYSTDVNGIIDFYGVVDITMEDGFPTTPNHQQSDSPEGYLLGQVNVLEHLEEAKKTNPITYLDHDVPPVLMMHGTKDRLVSFQHSIKLYKALKERHQDVTFYRIKNADHGGPAFYTDQVLDIVIDFMNQHLKD